MQHYMLVVYACMLDVSEGFGKQRRQVTYAGGLWAMAPQEKLEITF